MRVPKREWQFFKKIVFKIWMWERGGSNAKPHCLKPDGSYNPMFETDLVRVKSWHFGIFPAQSICNSSHAIRLQAIALNLVYHQKICFFFSLISTRKNQYQNQIILFYGPTQQGWVSSHFSCIFFLRILDVLLLASRVSLSGKCFLLLAFRFFKIQFGPPSGFHLFNSQEFCTG